MLYNVGVFSCFILVLAKQYVLLVCVIFAIEKYSDVVYVF